MKDIPYITACFVDHGGLYLPLAQKLSESYKRIIYFDPCERAFPKVNESIVANGFEGIDRVESFWPLKSEIDLFIFPDSQGSGLQIELASQGFPVWGSRTSENLEQSREHFHQVLEDVGLEVPAFQRIVGLEKLRKYLADQTDKYIKISKYRGSLETCHWRGMDDDEGMLDSWAVKFGGVKDRIPFLVFDAIDTDLEIGGDTYCINGQWPESMMDGFECKDKGYFGAFKSLGDMPEQTQSVLEAFGPVLGRHGHANFWSMEIRVVGDSFFFIDATPRGPLPGIGSQMEVYANLPEIILAGAGGELIQPEPTALFAAECALIQKNEKQSWGSVEVPGKLRRWMKLGGSCLVNGRTWFPPDESHENEIGWLVAIGDTPKETVDTMLEQADQLPDGVEANTDCLVDLLKEIHQAEDEGIEFTDQKVPEPETALNL